MQLGKTETTAEREPSAAELDARRSRVGLSVPALARLSDVHHDTAYRFLNSRQDVLRRTKTALIRGLEAYEIALRDELLALHPVVSSPTGESRPAPRADVRGGPAPAQLVAAAPLMAAE